MIASKRIAAVTMAVVVISLFICGGIVYAANVLDTANVTAYQEKLFGDEILTIDIQVDETDWQSLLDNAQAKEWISGDLLINGELYSTVGIRTKGNSSLTQMSNAENARYSLQFKFDEYVKGQTAYGLDAFCVNNMMGDATYMKDYISYDIMRYIGVEAPLTNFASVTVNGEAYCFGIALERYDHAYLDRAYNTSGGQLYSVKIQMGGRGDFEDARLDTAAMNAAPPAWESQPEDGGETAGVPSERGRGPMNGGGMGGGIGGFGGQSGGGSLLYTDDEISSYSAIFDNPVFKKNSDMDKERVITAIKNLNEGTDLEEYFDVEAILRYFAAHNFVVNLDSYSSNMQQNYYIYERDGQLTILPWDYGLAFGGFQSRDASSVVNFPIDTPVSGVSIEDRPLLNKLLEVDEYRETYRAYMQEIADGYFAGGLFEGTIEALDEKIGEYVKNDATAYFTYEEYATAVGELKKLGKLRAQSVQGQLDGTIPSTTAGQSEDASALIDASTVNLAALGSTMGGGGGGNRDGANGQQGGQGGFAGPGGNTQDREAMRSAMQIIEEAGGELTEEARAALIALGITEEQIEMFLGFGNGGFSGGRNMGGNASAPAGETEMPPGFQGAAGITGQGSTGGSTENMAIIGAMLLVLIGVTVFIARPRKHVV